MNIVLGLLGISLLIALHELGHYAAARLCRLPVLTFAIGFGPALIKHERNGTVFRINLLPLGGYVTTPLETTRNSSVPVRLFFYAAGVLMNICTAIAFLTFVFTCTDLAQPDGLPLGQGLWFALIASWEIMREAFSNFFHLLTGALSFEQLNGPLQVLQVAGEATELGGAFALYFLSFLSLQLAVLNLLPIPSLDGSHLLFALLELLRGGQKIPLEKEALVHTIGVVLLFLLMVFVTVKELLV